MPSHTHPPSATVASVLLPSLKATLPVGVLVPVVVTVAVNVTESPKFDGLPFDTTAVAVDAPVAFRATARWLRLTDPRPTARLYLVVAS